VTGEPVGAIPVDAPFVICGQIDPNFQNPTVDSDAFQISFATLASSTVRIFISDPTGLTRVDAGTNDAAQTQTFGFGRNQGDHLAYILPHPMAIDYVTFVNAQATAATTAPIPYKIVITPGGSASCPAITGAPAYSEAHDGATNTDNDIFTRDSLRFRYTASPADVAEPTALTPAATPLRISGNAAAVTSVDLFADRDTFAITTGATTNELAIRLTWPDANRFMWLGAFVPNEIVQPQNEAPPVAENNRDGIILLAVEPDKPYFVFAGALKGAGNLPAMDYDLAICGATVASP
jgi:hypothetical protein